MTALICVCGPDGAGKSTVAAMLPAMLAPITSRVFAHEHPGICNPWAAALSYAAQRAEVASRMALGMEPAIVIADRWAFCAEANALTRGDDAAYDLALLEYENLPRPALVVVIDAPDDVLAARRPDASKAERCARQVYRDPVVLARWGAVVVSAEGDAREVAWRVARLVMDVVAREAPGDGR